MKDISTTPRKNKINIVPSDKNLNYIMENKKLSPAMRQEFCNLHSTDQGLKDFLEKEMEITDKVVKEFVVAGNSFDFSWPEYTLRDAIVKEFDNFFSFRENLRMLGLDDDETMEKLRDVLRIPDGSFMTVLLYYGAPSDTDHILSGIRFIDVIGSTNSTDDPMYHRSSFLRYSRDI